MLVELSNKDTTEQQNRAGNKNYIIITTNKFLPAVQEFAAWKIRMGYTYEIVSQVSWTATQVKNAVQTRYNNWNPKPEYLLIVGDHEDVPGEVYTWGTYGDYATDLYYVCMGGTTDYTADMARGRVSVNSLEQAYSVLRKIINYEKNPIINTSFYQTGVNCTIFQDYDPLDGYEDLGSTYATEQIRDYMISKGKIINRIYSANNNVYPMYYNNGYYAPSPAISIPSGLLKPTYPWNGNKT